jgi:hypothetical protein
MVEGCGGGKLLISSWQPGSKERGSIGVGGGKS